MRAARDRHRLSSRHRQVDGAFYDWDHRTVHCGVDLDSDTDNGSGSIDSALDRAADRGEVAELYAHHPTVTIPDSTIEYVLAGAQQRGLTFYTYEDLADPTTPAGPGLALSFDDTSVDDWVATLPLFEQYAAHVTFFVSRYRYLSDAQHAELHTLADAGNAIEAHTVLHLRGPEYVEDHGLDAYMDDEVMPSISALRDEGFPVNAFAYPFGARTTDTDSAILGNVKVLRSVSFTWNVVASPCPR